MNITKTHRGIGIAGLGATAFAFAVMLTGAASAAELSDAAKAKLANGHWGGTYGDAWISGPYAKNYKADRALSETARTRTAGGHWGGTYGDAWLSGPYQKPYKANPQVSAVAKEKMSRGKWGGKYTTVWVPASTR
jgi:hypothetical protein